MGGNDRERFTALPLRRDEDILLAPLRVKLTCRLTLRDCKWAHRADLGTWPGPVPCHGLCCSRGVLRGMLLCLFREQSTEQWGLFLPPPHPFVGKIIQNVFIFYLFPFNYHMPHELKPELAQGVQICPWIQHRLLSPICC